MDQRIIYNSRSRSIHVNNLIHDTYLKPLIEMKVGDPCDEWKKKPLMPFS